MSEIKYKVGYRVQNKQGDWMEIIERNSCNDVIVKFDNGETLSVKSGYLSQKRCNVLPPSKKSIYKKNERHGDRYTKLWKSWNTMLWRCNPKNKRHHVWYSDRGIKVCEEWQSYTRFKEWALSNGFKEGLTIDRIDSNKNYEPCNCRWITQAENVKNIKECKSWISVSKYDLNGNFIETYRSISSASKSVDKGTREGIKKCCDKIINEYKGFRWEYAN